MKRLRPRLPQISPMSLVNWLIAIILAIMFGVGSYALAPRFLPPEVLTDYPWALVLTSIVFAVSGFGLGLSLAVKDRRHT